MGVIERLTCPFGRSHLNSGAAAFRGCGAVCGGRPCSDLVILLVFPTVAAILAVVMYVSH